MFDANSSMELRNQILTYFVADLMTDAERAKLLGLPAGCRIRERAKILCREKLTIGTNVWIGEGAILDAQGGLTIGSNTQIGAGVFIWTHTSHLQAIEGKTGSSTKEGIKYKETTIGSNCFIAGPSVIAPGITIGDRVVVSPLTFVDRDLADGERVSGPRDLKTLARQVEQLAQQVGRLTQERDLAREKAEDERI